MLICQKFDFFYFNVKLKINGVIYTFYLHRDSLCNSMLKMIRAQWDSCPKFRNPVEKNHKGGRFLPRKILGFLEIFAFMK